MKREKFVVLTEWWASFNLLSLEQKGMMLQALYDYNSDVDVQIEDVTVNAIFQLIKPNIDRMQSNYDRSVENGKKGGRPKKTQNNLKKPTNNPTERGEKPLNINKNKNKNTTISKRGTGTDVLDGFNKTTTTEERIPKERVKQLLSDKETQEALAKDFERIEKKGIS